MIPPALAEVADEHGWKLVTSHRSSLSGTRWATLSHLDLGLVVDVRHDRWRHTTARAYRGRALSAMLTGQRAIAEYLRT